MCRKAGARAVAFSALLSALALMVLPPGSTSRIRQLAAAQDASAAAQLRAEVDDLRQQLAQAQDVSAAVAQVRAHTALARNALWQPVSTHLGAPRPPAPERCRMMRLLLPRLCVSLPTGGSTISPSREPSTRALAWKAMACCTFTSRPGSRVMLFASVVSSISKPSG